MCSAADEQPPERDGGAELVRACARKKLNPQALTFSLRHIMGGALQINGEDLSTLAGNLSPIQTTHLDSTTEAKVAAGLVRHARLAATVREFSSYWMRRRAELTDQVDVLILPMSAVVDAFEQVDAELACTIEWE